MTRARRWTLGLALGLLSALLHSGALFSELTSDARITVAENVALRDTVNAPHLFGPDFAAFTQAPRFQPVTALTHMADLAVWGERAWGHHLTNLLIHLLVVVGVHRLIWRVTGRERLAALTGLLFAVHPVHVEAVTAVGHRGQLLAALFTVWGLLGWLRFSRWAGGRWRAGALAPLSLAAAALSATVGMVFPALLLALRRHPARRWPPWAHLALWGALSSVWIWLLAVLTVWRIDLAWPARSPIDLDPLALFGYFVKQLGHWLRAGLFPFPQTPHVNPEPYLSGFNALAVVGLVGVIALVPLLIEAKRRPLLRLVLALWLIPLIPAMNFIPLPEPLADRYLYLPSVGIALGLAALTLWLGRNAHRAAGWALGLALTFGGAVLIPLNTLHWRDDTALWTHALEVDERDVFARAQLARALAAEGDWESAHAEAVQALHGDVTSSWARLVLVESLAVHGQRDQALGQLLYFEDYPPRDRQSAALVQLWLARLLLDIGQRDLAEGAHSRAIDLNRSLEGSSLDLPEVIAGESHEHADHGGHDHPQ